METLHIYAQDCWHDEAWIAGNRDGLVKLRNAIDKAIVDGNGSSKRVFTNDSEAYQVKVIKLTDEQLGKLYLPYTDKDISEGSGTEWPWTF